MSYSIGGLPPTRRLETEGGWDSLFYTHLFLLSKMDIYSSCRRVGWRVCRTIFPMLHFSLERQQKQWDRAMARALCSVPSRVARGADLLPRGR